ncbi:MAG: hypothetical protein ACK449_17075 [Planctomycetota bacterium]
MVHLKRHSILCPNDKPDESIDADTGIEDHKLLSGEATRERAFKTFESESYKSEVTLTTLFPDLQSVSGGVAFNTAKMTNDDSWSFLTIFDWIFDKLGTESPK